MYKMRLIVALVVVLALVVVGCGGIESGTVEKKSYEPENTYFMMLPIQTGQICSGNPSICTPIMSMFPFWIHDDEDYVLHLRDGEKTGKVTVSQQTYEATAIGSEFGDAKDKKYADENQSAMSRKKPPKDEFENTEEF
jgi:hypothetical protein